MPAASRLARLTSGVLERLRREPEPSKEDDEALLVTLERLAKTVTPVELRRVAKTDTVVVDPRVVARFFLRAARHPRNEVAGLLIGHVDGRFLHVRKLHLCAGHGTRTNYEFTARDYDMAAKMCRDAEAVVGSVHSHPGHGVFLSPTDVLQQSDSQALFADYVSMVMDPFTPDGVGFRFFRVADNLPVELRWFYLAVEP